MNYLRFITITLLLFINTLSAQTFTSNSQRVNLIELYTSQGCSSCPPADKWLASFRHDPGLWSQFIPLAFHVDYWDYIGWQDVFASPLYTARQYQYKSQHNISSVYTPAVVANGQEWARWYQHTSSPTFKSEQIGSLSIELDNHNIKANFHPLIPQDEKLIVNIAILGFDLEVQIKAGENTGRALKHDFVVLNHQQVSMNLSAEGDYTIAATPLFQSKHKTTAIVAWINNSTNLKPIQATGGWLN